MRFLSALILLMLSARMFAQSNPPPANSAGEVTIATYPEQPPEFPGGERELIKFIQKNIQYPSDERTRKAEGTVTTRFLVERNGKIKDALVIKGVESAPGLNKEALRIIGLMPDWKPAKMNGETVPVYYYLPVKFTLPK